MKELAIKNSTIQFLAFVSEQGGNTVDIAFRNGDLWATEKVMSMLYGIDRSGIARHIKNIFADNELDESSVCAIFAHTANDGKNYQTQFYNLDMIISEKTNMGLTSWENAPVGKIVKTDVVIAKNYLTKNELESLGRIVNAYLDLAEDRAKKGIPTTMRDWANRLDRFLLADDRDLLQNAGKITAKIAKDKAENEFEKYRIKQDQLYTSDFDRFIQLEENAKS